ncbi:disrupted in schizophrenia 1 protein isoform X5 [Phycodurus eques]|uniref:disrupted in schizophrenia 1 protein isoform X5 n=1 Tax=Phycodurus eques TaxID=693459 RepID=UPI002ACDCC9A|nr:disrupted in schizophrenia 1 protein isoform X5 [Phycodurus eques]
MFAGLLGLKCHGNSLHHHSQGVMEGGRASGTAGSVGRKRLHWRPGYMRGEQSRPQSTTDDPEDEEEEEDKEEREDGDICIRNGKSGCQTKGIISSAVKISPMNIAQPEKSSHDIPLPFPNDSAFSGASSQPKSEHMLNHSLVLQHSATPEESFSSSFSFIQQSLRTFTAPATPARDPQLQATEVPNFSQIKPASLFPDQSESKPSSQVTSNSNLSSHEERETLSLGGRFWGEHVWGSREVSASVPDGGFPCLDTEITSSLSLDSDTASASSVTSGYESATPSSDQGWDNLIKKYDHVLQNCLHNNRTHTKIESMMLKLQRLQQKAIVDDDYDAAERFGKKLEELYKERGALKLGLPSRQPSVALFLQRLREVMQSALHRADSSQPRSGAEFDAGERSDAVRSRDRFIQEKRTVEEEIKELQQRLAELKDRSRCLDQQIQQEEQHMEAEELEGSVLRSCTTAQLQDMSQSLHDLVMSKNRIQISVSPPASMLRGSDLKMWMTSRWPLQRSCRGSQTKTSRSACRLQEQEQALNLSIKEATAKVVMSQKLGSSLRRKVSETETQLLALHEAKLAAISENQLKDNAVKYSELLEDRLRSCSCSGLERIWEADLEACHLFLRGLQLRISICSGADVDDHLTTTGYASTQMCPKEEEDCAMLTALGGRWCSEANLQNSEFTKKLEEFLFCMEDNSPQQDVSSDDEAADLAERCELISDRLMTLEDDLQTAILSRDQTLAESLEKQVQEVKTTLQNMLALLREEVEEEVHVHESQDEDDPVENGILEEEEEEEEDQYFSDSWDI